MNEFRSICTLQEPCAIRSDRKRYSKFSQATRLSHLLKRKRVFPGIMDIDSQSSEVDSQNVLDTVEGEIQFFRAIMRARPVGIHRHFHMMSIKAALDKEIGQDVPIEAIWRKLESCYNLEALEALVCLQLLLFASILA